MKTNLRERRGILLCYPFTEHRLNKWPTPWYVQPKLEGDRCRAVWDPNIGYVLYSSTERPILSVPHINRALNDLNITEELDGELYNHDLPHEQIHGIVSRTVNIHRNYKDCQFHIFDANLLDKTQAERDKWLRETIPRDEHIYRVSTSPVADKDSLYEMYESYFLDMHYEGIVVRHKDGLYVPKRSIHAMKLKPRQVDHYVCVEIHEETSIEGIPKYSLGAITVQDADGNRFRVGTGFTQKQRQEYWDHPNKILGKVIEVRYQALTEKGVPKMSSFQKVLE